MLKKLLKYDYIILDCPPLALMEDTMKISKYVDQCLVVVSQDKTSAYDILESVDGILKRLNTDYIDMLLLHRPDALVEPEEDAEAFEKLEKSGKVKYAKMNRGHFLAHKAKGTKRNLRKGGYLSGAQAANIRKMIVG